MNQYVLRFFLLLILGLSGATALAQPAPFPVDGSFAARNRMQVLPDPTGQLTLREVLRQSDKFRPVQTDIVQVEPRRQPHWLRVWVVNPSARKVPLIAEVDYPFLESVAFFLVSADGYLQARSLPVSWTTPRSGRLMEHYNPLFAFTMLPHQTGWLYLRSLGGKMRQTVPLRLHTATGFSTSDRGQHLFWGFTMGVLGFILFFSLLLFALLRDPVYAYYGLYVTASYLYLTANKGYWLIWLDRPYYGPVSAIDFPILSYYVAILGSFLLIQTYVLPPVMHHRWVRRVLRMAIGGLLLAMLLVVFNISMLPATHGLGSVLHMLEPICYGVPVLSMTVLLFYLSLRRTVLPDSAATNPARLYLLAITPPLIQVVLGLLREQNLIADGVLIREGTALAVLLEVLILSVALIFRYKRIFEDRRRLTEESHLQQQVATQAQLQIKQQQVHILETQLRLQREKERIARDLHDHVGSQLSIIATTLDGASQQPDNGRMSDWVMQVSTYAHDAIQSLRDTIWAIHQETLTLVEFRLKLQQYLLRQQPLAEPCRLALNADDTAPVVLSSSQALNLFRIMQESLNNAFKYAGANQITVAFRVETNGCLSLSITDDGWGFLQCSQPDSELHYGLLNMQQRAADLNGICTIDTQMGKGTVVSVVIPLTGLLQSLPTVPKNTAVAV